MYEAILDTYQKDKSLSLEEAIRKLREDNMETPQNDKSHRREVIRIEVEDKDYEIKKYIEEHSDQLKEQLKRDF